MNVEEDPKDELKILKRFEVNVKELHHFKMLIDQLHTLAFSVVYRERKVCVARFQTLDFLFFFMLFLIHLPIAFLFFLHQQNWTASG